MLSVIVNRMLVNPLLLYFAGYQVLELAFLGTLAFEVRCSLLSSVSIPVSHPIVGLFLCDLIHCRSVYHSLLSVHHRGNESHILGKPYLVSDIARNSRPE